MGRMNKFVVICALLLSLCSHSLASENEGKCGKKVNYSFNENSGLLTISGTGNMNSYNSSSPSPWHDYKSAIKNVIIGYGVTSIGDFAFELCYNLVSVSIPSSVTEIGQFSFSFCSSLTSLEFPEGLSSIGVGVCHCCYKLSSVKIPHSLKEIPAAAFVSCAKLASVTIPGSVTSIGNYSFMACRSLSQFIYLGTDDPCEPKVFDCTPLNEVIAFMNYTGSSFCGTNVRKISSLSSLSSSSSSNSRNSGKCGEFCHWTLKGNVLTIFGFGNMTDFWKKNPEWHYHRNSIESVTILNGITSIGAFAFAGYGLETVEIPPSVTVVEYSAFAFSSLKTVTIPNSVTIIGQSAFDGCTNLSSVTLPNSLTMVGNYAFQRAGLTSIIIPDSVEKIETCAFKACLELKSVTIPKSVSLENETFRYCWNLTHFHYPGNKDPDLNLLFDQCPLREVFVPNDYNDTEFCGKNTTKIGSSGEDKDYMVIVDLKVKADDSTVFESVKDLCELTDVSMEDIALTLEIDDITQTSRILIYVDDKDTATKLARQAQEACSV